MARESAAERAERERMAPPEDWADQNVHTALVRVMRDLPEVGKDSQNEESPDRFRFRGIDAVVNAAGPLFRKHGVVHLPKVLKASIRPVRTSDGEATIAWVRVQYTFWGPDGSKRKATVPGEAIDTGDKALNKAMSVAWRTALIQVLAIPTGERDADASTYRREGTATPPAAGGSAPGRAARGQRPGGPADPRQEWWDRIAAKATELSMTTNDVRRHFARWSGGRQIDGPGVTVEMLQRYLDEMASETAEQPSEQPPVPAGAPAEAELEQERAAAALLHSELGAEPIPGGSGG